MTTLNTHRLRAHNAPLVLQALARQGVYAQQVQAPHSELGITWIALVGDPSYDPRRTAQTLADDVAGFVGIQTPLSGKQFHKRLVSLGII